MKAIIINDSGEAISENFLTAWVKDVAVELKTRGVLTEEKTHKELSLVFLREPDAKNLNWTHRQKDYATDILSFETEDPESIGELVMCPAVLMKQAKEHGIPEEQEVGYMILHGVLHLLGFDHEKGEEDARTMMKLQDAVHQALLDARRPKKAKSAAAKKVLQAAPKGKAVKAAKPAKAAKAMNAAPAKAAKTTRAPAAKPAKKAAKAKSARRK